MIKSGRRTLTGCAVGSGWVQGQIRRVDDPEDGVALRHIAPHEVADEVRQLDGAIDAVVTQMRRALDKFQERRNLIVEGGDVLNAHLNLAKDPEIRRRVVDMITDKQINASWGLKRVLAHVEDEFAALDDPYIASRILDVQQVFTRLQRQLSGAEAEQELTVELGSADILLARDLEPVRALAILEQSPAAIITEEGSATSHLALLCRALGVPGMVGVKGATEHLLPGDQVLIDLEEGVLVRAPDRRDVAMAKAHSVEGALHLADPVLPAVTEDGAQITLLANLDTTVALADARVQGADGVGLFRSEYLYLRRAEHEDQVDVYRQILSGIDGPVTVRTFDIGSDKLPLGQRREPNPALGLRALRSYQVDPRAFRQQLSGLMRAATADGRLRILLPMVDGVESWAWAVDEVERSGEAEGKRRGVDYHLGAMIELPSALFAIDELAERADFLCLGTNDLIQYLLGVDRQNPQMSGYAKMTHPAVLRALKRVIESSAARQVPLSCCGEMASSAVGIMILVGLGLRRLSLPPLDLGRARTFLRRSRVSVFEGLVDQALSLDSAVEIESMLQAHYQDWKLDQSR